MKLSHDIFLLDLDIKMKIKSLGSSCLVPCDSKELLKVNVKNQVLTFLSGKKSIVF